MKIKLEPLVENGKIVNWTATYDYKNGELYASMRATDKTKEGALGRLKSKIADAGLVKQLTEEIEV